MPEPRRTESRTVPARESVVRVEMAPDSEFHMLIGGPYEQGGEQHRYGHTAVRIKTPVSDTVFDFGRYGATTGDFGAEGEGILRVWSNFGKYIAGENVLGRTTTAYVYRIFSRHTRPAAAFFEGHIAGGRRREDRELGRSYLRVFQLQQSYHALGPNCTTISLDAASAIWPTYEEGSMEYMDPGAVLSFAERAALKLYGTPDRLFLPENLQRFLDDEPPIRVDRKETYP